MIQEGGGSRRGGAKYADDFDDDDDELQPLTGSGARRWRPRRRSWRSSSTSSRALGTRRGQRSGGRARPQLSHPRPPMPHAASCATRRPTPSCPHMPIVNWLRCLVEVPGEGAGGEHRAHSSTILSTRRAAAPSKAASAPSSGATRAAPPRHEVERRARRLASPAAAARWRACATASTARSVAAAGGGAAAAAAAAKCTRVCGSKHLGGWCRPRVHAVADGVLGVLPREQGAPELPLPSSTGCAKLVKNKEHYHAEVEQRTEIKLCDECNRLVKLFEPMFAEHDC